MKKLDAFLIFMAGALFGLLLLTLIKNFANPIVKNPGCYTGVSHLDAANHLFDPCLQVDH